MTNTTQESRNRHERRAAAGAEPRQKQRLDRFSYGIGEVANALGVSSGFIRLEIERGRLESFRLGRRVLIKKASFDAYIEAGQVA